MWCWWLGWRVKPPDGAEHRARAAAPLDPRRRAPDGVFPVCRAWRELALRAFAEGADAARFFGADVEVVCPDCYSQAERGFKRIELRASGTFPRGCVVLREERAPPGGRVSRSLPRTTSAPTRGFCRTSS